MARVNFDDPVQRAAALEYQKAVDRLREESKQAIAEERRGPTPALTVYTLVDLTRLVFPPRRALLYRGEAVMFRGGHIGEIYGERGFGKSWVMQTIALVLATGTDALGFRNPTPCKVLLVDGEMASEEIQERFEHLRRKLGIPNPALLDDGELAIVAADWQDDYLPRVDTVEGQAALEPFVSDADVVLLDNRSCLFDSEGEKDPSAWQPAQDYLLSLRRRGKAVLLAHHSNRQGGARWISKAEDAMNLLVKLTRPEDYTAPQGARFVVTFDKTRGIYGAAVAPFVAALTPQGWTVNGVERTDDVTPKILAFLAAADAVGERPTSASAVVRGAGVNKAAGLAAVAALTKTGRVRRAADGYKVVATTETEGDKTVPAVPNGSGTFENH